MQAFYFIVEPTMFHYEHYKVYGETKMEAKLKLQEWLKVHRDYYPAAPNNISEESHPSRYNINDRVGWRYLVK